MISTIVPDAEMPHDADGKPYEMLLNPLGLISRVNAGQAIEAALGKIVEKTGREPYKPQDFASTEDMTQFAMDELRKNGLQDLEDVIDPETGRTIKNVLTGNRFIMKLQHMAESKAQGRGFGSYTQDQIPSKGSDAASKRLGLLETSALLSYGAPHVLQDAGILRGQAAPQYWAQYMSGYDPPPPQIPRVYDKFVNHLKAAGINVVRDGPRLHVMALTNKDVDLLAGGRPLRNADTVDYAAGLKPVPGGLMDEELTGGSSGNRWSYVALHEPMPNPVFEEPIRRLLGLTEARFLDVLAGKEELRGKTGPEAIRHALESINLPRELEKARAEIHGSKKTARDAAIRRFGYLKSAERLGIHPKDWVLDKVPVLPPMFRPVSVMQGSGTPLVADSNFLYRELWDANENLKQLSGSVDDVGEERRTLYNAFKAVTGLGDPTHPKNVERKVKGVLGHVFGSLPKWGLLQRKLLGHAVDLVGRAVVTPNPDLDMDHVGLPEKNAWDIYKPFIVRRLVRSGTNGVVAARAVKDRSPVARQALLAEMAERPVIINRAPTLHRYGLVAAWPKLVKGNTVETSPLIVKPMGMDYDGDMVNFHVPASDKAVDEAIEKMLPSRNLFAVNSFRKVNYAPTQEYTGGLYEASDRLDRRNPPAVFHTVADAIRAYRSGEIGADRQVKILSH